MTMDVEGAVFHDGEATIRKMRRAIVSEANVEIGKVAVYSDEALCKWLSHQRHELEVTRCACDVILVEEEGRFRDLLARRPEWWASLRAAGHL